MRLRVVRALLRASVGIAATFSLGCGMNSDSGGAMGAPADPGLPSTPPSTPAPTGSKWEGVEVEGDCGRLSIAWLLVDEMCGGVNDPGYLDSLRAPIFRDGAVIENSLFTVDATHLWVLDVEKADAPARRTLIAGLEHPIATGMHAGRLLVAAGDAGLLLLDVEEPDDPVTLAVATLPGPALDVTVDGDRALVPMGKQGIAVIDLAPTLAVPPAAPVLVRTVPSPGFAVGVAADGNIGYVAACDTFASVDLESGELIGQGWLEAYEGELLVAPAKDVTIAGNMAFVAAGRFGAVAVDVSVPETPSVLGQCTIEDDLAFYASGVRSQGDTLYVAGGEWGILPVDLSAPGACGEHAHPMLPQHPREDDDSCNVDPPWTVLPWQDIWAPPPSPPVTPGVPFPGKDPLQTLPMGDLLYAFGDARRLGVRAVDVRSSKAPDLTKLGRYEEPRLVVDLAAHEGRVLVVGPAGGLFTAHDATLLEAAASPPGIADGVAAAMLVDGRFAFVTSNQLHIEGHVPIPLPQTPTWHGLSSREGEVVVAFHEGLWRFYFEPDAGELMSVPKAELPPAVLAHADGVYVAAPEWVHALRVHDYGSYSLLLKNGVFDQYEVLDANLWREGLPRRLLADSPYGIVEIATLGARAGLTIHGTSSGSTTLALPRGTYVDAATSGDWLYLVLADRNLYRSTLLTVKLGAGAAEIVESQAFTGIGMALATDGDRLYLADADRGVRVYSIAENAPLALGVVELEMTP
jgi:hypothetical protein